MSHVFTGSRTGLVAFPSFAPDHAGIADIRRIGDPT